MTHDVAHPKTSFSLFGKFKASHHRLRCVLISMSVALLNHTALSAIISSSPFTSNNGAGATCAAVCQRSRLDPADAGSSHFRSKQKREALDDLHHSHIYLDFFFGFAGPGACLARPVGQVSGQSGHPRKPTAGS